MPTGASMMFSQRGHVRIKVELLEDHADLAPLCGDCIVGELLKPALAQPITDLLSIDHD